MNDYGSFIQRYFTPGGIYAFVGSGGKSTALKKVAASCTARGLRVRMTTTTRVSREEFSGFPLTVVRTASEMKRALTDSAPVRLIASRELAADGGQPAKLAGIEPALVDSCVPGGDTVLLVEADGSRRKPMKVPTEREPVIPGRSTAVFAHMGASAFGEPIGAAWCYNPEGALRILNREAGRFTPEALAVLATHPRGYRKGVPAGTPFHLIINQGDIGGKRGAAERLLALLEKEPGIEATIISWLEEEVYESTLRLS